MAKGKKKSAIRRFRKTSKTLKRAARFSRLGWLGGPYVRILLFFFMVSIPFIIGAFFLILFLLLAGGGVTAIISMEDDWDGGTDTSVEEGSDSGDSSRPPTVSGEWLLPAEGVFTSAYKMRWGKQHKGIDIASGGAPVPIWASEDGVAVRAGDSPANMTGFGTSVVLDHDIDGAKYSTLYGHMVKGSLTIKEGDVVKKGDVIGKMGTTGQSFGVHLHFEIHPGGWNPSRTNAVDPQKYVCQGKAEQTRC